MPSPYLRTANFDNSLQVGRPNMLGSSSQNAHLKARPSLVISTTHTWQRLSTTSGLKPRSLKGESERSFLGGSNECSMETRFRRLHTLHIRTDSRVERTWSVCLLRNNPRALTAGARICGGRKTLRPEDVIEFTPRTAAS